MDSDQRQLAHITLIGVRISNHFNIIIMFNIILLINVVMTDRIQLVAISSIMTPAGTLAGPLPCMESILTVPDLGDQSETVDRSIIASRPITRKISNLI